MVKTLTVEIIQKKQVLMVSASKKLFLLSSWKNFFMKYEFMRLFLLTLLVIDSQKRSIKDFLQGFKYPFVYLCAAIFQASPEKRVCFSN